MEGAELGRLNISGGESSLNVIQSVLYVSSASTAVEIKRDKAKAFIEHYEKAEVT